MLRNIIHNGLNCTHLVAAEGTVDSVPVKVLVLAFLDLVLVEDWEPFVEEVFKLTVKRYERKVPSVSTYLMLRR